MVVGNQAPQHNNAQKDDYCYHGKRPDRSAASKRVALLFIVRNRDEKAADKGGPDGNQYHFCPKGEVHKLAHRLGEDHDEAGYQLQDQATDDPRTEAVNRLAKRLIGPRPAQNSQENHEQGTHYDCDTDNVDGLDPGDQPTFVNSEGVTE